MERVVDSRKRNGRQHRAYDDQGNDPRHYHCLHHKRNSSTPTRQGSGINPTPFVLATADGLLRRTNTRPSYRLPDDGLIYPFSRSSLPPATSYSSTTSPMILALSVPKKPPSDYDPKKIVRKIERTIDKAARDIHDSIERVVKKRPYLADMRDPFEHFRPMDLLTCVLRAALQAAAVPVHKGLEQIIADLNEDGEGDEEGEGSDDEEEEEQGREERTVHVHMPDWKALFRHFEWKMGFNILRSLVVKTIHHSILEPLCVHYLHPRLVDRLTKDIIKSATRKNDRKGHYGAAYGIVRTAAFGNLNLNLSNLFWDFLMIGYDMFVERYPKYRLGPKPPMFIFIDEEGREYVRRGSGDEEARKPVSVRVRNALLVNGTAYAASIVLMSLGTLVYPGHGTMIGGVLADIAPLALGI